MGKGNKKVLRTFDGLKGLFGKISDREKAEKALAAAKAYAPTLPKSRMTAKRAAAVADDAELLAVFKAPKGVKWKGEEGPECGTYAGIADLIRKGLREDAAQAITRVMRGDGQKHEAQLKLALSILRNVMTNDKAYWGVKHPNRLSRDVRYAMLGKAESVLRYPVVAQQAIAEGKLWNDLEEPPPQPKEKVGDSLRDKLEKASHELSVNGDLVAAGVLLAEVIRQYGEKEAVRLSLIPAYNLLKAQTELDAEHAIGRLEQNAALRKITVDKVLDKITETMLGAEPFEAREERALRLDNIEVDLPFGINRMTTVEDVPVIVSIDGVMEDRVAAKLKAERLAGSVFLIRCKCVGVPMMDGKEYSRAASYVMKKYRCELQDLPMRRPDNDATWFPLINAPFRIGYSSFPDTVPRTNASVYGIDADDAVLHVKLERVRSSRLAFEEEFRVDYDTLRRLEAIKAQAYDDIREHGEKIKAIFGAASVSREQALAYCNRKRNEELADTTDWRHRMMIRRKWEEKKKEVVDLVLDRSKAQVMYKHSKDSIERIEEQLNSEKLRRLKPTMAHLESSLGISMHG